jgi:hypothetical protein
MYDDFWSGYNYGNTPLPPNINMNDPMIKLKTIVNKQQLAAGVYDKSKYTRLKGPNGEQAEIYANGKMYIMLPDGKSQVRTFPSRPWGIRYMQKRGWVLVV